MHWLTQHTLIVLGVIAVGLATVFVLQQRRSPQSAAAWVLAFVLVPYVAIPIFLMLGFRKRAPRFAPITLPRPDPEQIAEAPRRVVPAVSGARPATRGNALSLHADADAARTALQETIAGARRSIDALFYIVADDAAGRDFVDRLTARARAGVAVRLNLDRLGTLRPPRAALDELRAAGGEVRYFSPLLQRPGRGHLNLRNHRKLLIADGARIWSGGRNVGAHYLGPVGDPWTDLSFDLVGPEAEAFAAVFASDWDVTGSARPPCRSRAAGMEGDAVLQLVPSGPDEPSDLLYVSLVSMIHRARTRIWLSTPYFVPTEPLQLALATALRNGVDLRIMVPERSNQFTADLARGAYLRELRDLGANVLRHQGGMLHAKAGLVDDVGWIGSANFDVRSLLLNFEIALVCLDAASVARLEAWFAMRHTESAAGIPDARLPRRVVEGLFRLGAPVL